MVNQCSCCGKFKKWVDLYGMANEDEEWFECINCMSEFDLERLGLKRK